MKIPKQWVTKFRETLTEVGLVAWLIIWMSFGAWITTLFPEEKLVINVPDWMFSILPPEVLPFLPFLVGAVVYYVRQRKKGSHAGKVKNLKRMIGNAFNLGMGPVASLSHIIVFV